MPRVVQVFSYLGSKDRLCNKIIGKLPTNYRKLHYVEPFGGTATVLINKKPSLIETFNDINDNLFAFFKVLKENPKELIKKIDNHLPSEAEHKRCLKNLDKKDLPYLEKAYSLFASYNGGINGFYSAFGFNKKPEAWRDKPYFTKLRQLSLIANRIRKVQLFCRPAQKIIKALDNKNAIFYLDPPYPETEQSGYSHQFTKDDFNKLVEQLKTIEGKFILSCYKKDWMTFPKNWKTEYQVIGISRTEGPVGRRTECLIQNY